MAQIVGQRSVSLAPVKDLFRLTGYYRGGCSPLGGRHHYPVYFQEDMIWHDKIAINAGARGVMLIMAPEDLLQATQATLADIVKPMSTG
jgi:Cys-tRNA(Pro)/Cys-tRNA(Cys) deacylase